MPDGGSHHPRWLGEDKEGTPVNRERKGFVFEVVEGSAIEAGAAERNVVPAKPLDQAETDRLLARLPKIDALASDRADFALREASQPPPLKGETIEGAFPPKPKAGGPGDIPDEKRALEVRRFQPEGDIPVAPRVSVTFNNPMVAVTSHDTLKKDLIPVKVTPEVEGTWRWVGTKTVFFEPTGRVPMATSFEVEVPAGTKDSLGNALSKAVQWKFQTPPVQLKGSQPRGTNIKLRPTIIAQFNQRIDAAKVLSKARVTAGGKPVAVSMLSDAELAELPLSKNKDMVGRWIAFRPNADLPKKTQVQVEFPAGTPSAEGPRLTTSSQSFDFRTYGPFDVDEARCGWRKDCRPLQPWQIRFTNPIDEDKFNPKWVKVTPAIAGLEVDVSHSNMSLRGLTKGRTTYKVELDGKMLDIYGQTLGDEDTLTFDVGEAPKMMSAPERGFVVLDPTAAKKRFSVYTINYDEVDVTLYKVEPSDYGAYLNFERDRNRRNKVATPPGKEVFAGKIATSGPPDELTEVPIDLAAGLDGSEGQVLLIAKPVGVDERQRRSQTIVAWVQVTSLGIDAFWDSGEMVAWVTDLATGKPVDGATVTLNPPGTDVLTDGNGVARFPLPAKAVGRQQLTVTSGNKRGFLPDNSSAWSRNGQWHQQSRKPHMRWLVFDDRQLYKPDETVSVKGIIRQFDPGEKGDIGAVAASELTELSYKVMGPRGNELTKGTTKVNVFGGFHLDFKLPKTPNLGWATIRFQTGSSISGAAHNHRFQIQEFRRPEFEVSARNSDGPHLLGGDATIAVTAAYYAGGPLPGAETTWSVTSSRGSFSPPNHPEWTFGTWVPWWRSGWEQTKNTYHSFSGTTDGSGEHLIKLNFQEIDPPRAMSIKAEATVMDVNRQAWTAGSTMLVHPSEVYVGLKTDRRFVEKDEPIEVDAIVADLDGKRVEGQKIEFVMVRLTWKRQRKKGWVQIEVDPQTCTKTSGKDPVRCTFEPKQGGQHRIRAIARDAKQRPNETELTVWVPGGERPPSKRLELEKVEFVPDKKDYAVGDVAKVLLQAPFSPAEALVTIRRDGIVDARTISLDGPSHTLEIPIEEWMIPNAHLHVQLSGSAPRTDDAGVPQPSLPRRPAYAAGGLKLNVPPVLRTLDVAVKPMAEKTEPGADTQVLVTVKDAGGKAVKDAQLTVVVVDESVLALSGYTLQDPISVFYQQRGSGTQSKHLRRRLLLASLDDLFANAGNQLDSLAETEEEEGAAFGASATRSRSRKMQKPGAPPMPSAMAPMEMAAMADGDAMAGKGGGGGGDAPIALRTNFDALAVFAPEVGTDADGTARVKVKLPDNLTRYRVMVIATHGDNHFGSGESSITARLPLMVRMSAPRFLNFGDRFDLPVVIQNQTDASMDVNVAVRATNATLTAGGGRTVTVPANDRVEVLFPTSAEMAGTARFQAGASSGAWSDAAEVSLPVWTPATTEAFATYGEIDGKGTVQPVQTPGEVVTQFGGLDVTTSSTQLQALTDAVLYLAKYPFGCAEQVASRVVSIAALKDVLTAFEAEGLPAPEELIASVDRDMQRLAGMQNGDGGWGFWRRGMESWPFLTVHVAHALGRAKDKGFKVPERMLANAHSYLRSIRNRFPSHYSERTRLTIESYALYTRDRLGDNDSSRAAQVLDGLGGLEKAGMEVVGWLYPVFARGQKTGTVKRIHKHLNNRVTETAGLAHFVTNYADGHHLILHSSRRVDGLLLEGLSDHNPKSDIIPKLVRGLLAHRTKGRWGNTQENAWVLLGLDRYFNVFEKTVPNFTARVWLGDGFAGEHKFKGRTTERHHIAIPMAHLAKSMAPQKLTIEKAGKGRLYYRLGMRYAPKSLKLEPSDHGFTVERTYEGVDDPADVTRDPQGGWVVKAGAKVRVKVTMVAPERRYHVALVDPMPAGFESLNPALKGTATIHKPGPKGGSPHSGRYRGWWWGPWYQHTNLRDERAEAFTSMLWGGVYTYTYYARATTPGRFIVPPPKAEEMYHPETFGRGASTVVTVK